MNRRDALMRMCGVGGAGGAFTFLPVSSEGRQVSLPTPCPVCGEKYQAKEVILAETTNAFDDYRTHEPLTDMYYHTDGGHCSIGRAVIVTLDPKERRIVLSRDSFKVPHENPARYVFTTKQFLRWINIGKRGGTN